MSIFHRSHRSCSRIAVESNANRDFVHFRRRRIRRGIIVSYSRIAIVI